MIAENETIHVAWPTNGEVNNFFAVSMLDLVTKVPQVKSYNSITGTGLLSKTRNLIVQHFLYSTEEDWLLLLDSDQFVALPAIDKLLSSADKESVPFISALIFASLSDINVDPSPCIFKENENGVLRAYMDYPEDSLVEIDAAGAGCVLVHRSVLERVQEVYKDPTTGDNWVWFQDGPVSPLSWVAEDMYFSRRVADSGIKLYAHTGAVLPHMKSVWVTQEHYRAKQAMFKKSSR